MHSRVIKAGVEIIVFGNNLDHEPDIATKARAAKGQVLRPKNASLFSSVSYP